MGYVVHYSLYKLFLLYTSIDKHVFKRIHSVERTAKTGKKGCKNRPPPRPVAPATPDENCGVSSRLIATIAVLLALAWPWLAGPARA